MHACMRFISVNLPFISFHLVSFYIIVIHTYSCSIAQPFSISDKEPVLFRQSLLKHFRQSGNLSTIKQCVLNEFDQFIEDCGHHRWREAVAPFVDKEDLSSISETAALLACITPLKSPHQSSNRYNSFFFFYRKLKHFFRL